MKTVFIRKSQLVQEGVVVEDGPTLDEIRDNEAKAAAAKKAALEAAMGDEDSEDETPDVLAAAEAAADDADESDDEAEEETADDVAIEEDAAEEEATEEEVTDASDEEPDYSGMKVAELKELLKAAGKPVSGKKAELIARLQE